MIRLLTEVRSRKSTRRADDAPDETDADAAVNRDIAARLRITADHLQAHDANPYRAASFRFAADSVAAQPRSLRAIYDERGREGLHALPGVGPGIAAMIDDILRTRCEARTAQRPRRSTHPPIELMLEADRELRAQSRIGVSAGPVTARQPGRTPVAGRELRIQRDGWLLRVFFSNSARAQELARTRDWVIVIASRGDQQVSQHTVVTETRGKLAGRRVVRGREAACRTFYARPVPAARPPDRSDG